MLKIAIAQLNPTVGAIAANADRILTTAQQAAAQGAHLLLTPELALCGYPPRDLLLNPHFIADMEQQLHRLAQRCPPELALLVGTVTPNTTAKQAGEKNLWNSVALLQHHRIEQRFHKCLLPSYDVFDEDRYFAAAHQSHCLSWQGMKIGVTICEDLWNDEAFWGHRNYAVNPLAELVNQGVDWVINLSASPYSVGKSQFRESLVRHTAKRFTVPLVYVNQCGGNDDLLFDGGSFAVDRQGEVVLRAPSFTEALCYLEFDPNQGDFLESIVTSPFPVKEAELFNALVMGVRDYLYKCGFSQAVLGLSGGIDSALVAAIAVAALGADNVLGILMPSPYSSGHSLSDAQALAANLGIQTQTLPIGQVMTAYDDLLATLFHGTSFGIAEENLQSRIRGNLLMAIANKFGHLLLTTGNKSEMAVGYCTLYGDMNGGLGAIADVPKTQVFALCRWLNREQEVIPANILHKPPSAELKPGQLDQDSLPPYDVLDDILDRLIHHHQAAATIIAVGHDPDVVHQVCRLVKRSEFKRRQAAPGLKVTDRAFGTGWRMPIAEQFPR